MNFHWINNQLLSNSYVYPYDFFSRNGRNETSRPSNSKQFLKSVELTESSIDIELS